MTKYLSVSRSLASNLKLMQEDGTVIEINSQDSLGTSPEVTPEKSNKEF